jgi:hypothetical protein
MACGCGPAPSELDEHGPQWEARCARTHLPCFSWTVTVPVMSSPLVYTLQMLRAAPYFTSAVGLPGGGSRAMVMSQEDEKMSEAASLAMATASDKIENILFESPPHTRSRRRQLVPFAPRSSYFSPDFSPQPPQNLPSGELEYTRTQSTDRVFLLWREKHTTKPRKRKVLSQKIR